MNDMNQDNGNDNDGAKKIGKLAWTKPGRSGYSEANPPGIIRTALLDKSKPPKRGPGYWAWFILAQLPVYLTLWSLALDWPWWGALAYFGGVLAIGILAGIANGRGSKTEVA